MQLAEYFSSGKLTFDLNAADEIDCIRSILPLQLSNRFRQTVLALDYWTSYSPTWDEQPNGMVKNRPPAYTGSTLGGIWRLRGYPSQRFNDKAAVYYAAELRMIPRWNPFNGWPWIQQYVGIQWLQFVPFVEVGRVAPEWNFNTLVEDSPFWVTFFLAKNRHVESVLLYQEIPCPEN